MVEKVHMYNLLSAVQDLNIVHAKNYLFDKTTKTMFYDLGQKTEFYTIARNILIHCKIWNAIVAL